MARQDKQAVEELQVRQLLMHTTQIESLEYLPLGHSDRQLLLKKEKLALQERQFTSYPTQVLQLFSQGRHTFVEFTTEGKVTLTGHLS